MDILHDKLLTSMVWIELIGFDNTSPDYGVGSFLERLGYAPEGVSFLMAQCGFVMHKADLSRSEKLTIAEASYGGHRYCPERER